MSADAKLKGLSPRQAGYFWRTKYSNARAVLLNFDSIYKFIDDNDLKNSTLEEIITVFNQQLNDFKTFDFNNSEERQNWFFRLFFRLWKWLDTNNFFDEAHTVKGEKDMVNLLPVVGGKTLSFRQGLFFASVGHTWYWWLLLKRYATNFVALDSDLKTTDFSSVFETMFQNIFIGFDLEQIKDIRQKLFTILGDSFKKQESLPANLKLVLQKIQFNKGKEQMSPELKLLNLDDLSKKFGLLSEAEHGNNASNARYQLSEEIVHLTSMLEIFWNKFLDFSNPARGNWNAKFFDQFKQRKTIWTNLQAVLNRVAKDLSFLKQLKVNGYLFSINSLVTEKSLPFYSLNDTNILQLHYLINQGIEAETINQNLDLLTQIDQVLQAMKGVDPKIATVKISDKTYSITNLNNSEKPFFALTESQSTRSTLPKSTIVQSKTLKENLDQQLQQMKLVYQEKVAAEKKLKEEKQQEKDLAIGLGTAGGIVVLTGAGGFAYWFLKIRKS